MSKKVISKKAPRRPALQAARMPRPMFPTRPAARSSFRVAAEETEATIYLYDEIGPWGVTADEFAKGLAEVTASTIHLRVNSPGGDVFDARAMVTALRSHHAKVIAHIDGVAASAASFLALACDEVEISDGAMIMIHRPWGWAAGDADELRSTATVLDQIESSMVDDYERKTGQPREQIAAWLAAETWFTAQEAVEYGFADRIAGASEGEEDDAGTTEETEEEPTPEAKLAARAKARRAYLAARLRLAEVSQ